MVNDDLPIARRVKPKRRRRSDYECPQCGSDDVGNAPWPWYLGTIGALIVSAKQCEGCGHQFDANKPEADLARRKMVLAIVLNLIGLVGILLVLGLLYWVLLNSGVVK